MTHLKNRKIPSAEWLGYPVLRLGDIEHKSIKFTEYIAKSLVDNRKGRVNLLMEDDFYQRFLKAVSKKFERISTDYVEKAVREAVEGWISEVESN